MGEAADLEIIPCVTPRMADEKPVCCLKQTDRHEARPIYDNAHKNALETILLLRQTKVCE